MVEIDSQREQADLIHQIESMPIEDPTREVYKSTCGPGPESEKSKGWAIGPFTEEEMTKHLGTSFWIDRGVSESPKVAGLTRMAKSRSRSGKSTTSANTSSMFALRSRKRFQSQKYTPSRVLANCGAVSRRRAEGIMVSSR